MIQLIGKEPLSANEIFRRLFCLSEKDLPNGALKSAFIEFSKSLPFLDLSGKFELHQVGNPSFVLVDLLAQSVYFHLGKYPSISGKEWNETFDSEILSEGSLLVKAIAKKTDLAQALTNLTKLSEFLAEDEYRYIPPLCSLEVIIEKGNWSIVGTRIGGEVYPHGWYSWLTIYTPLKHFLPADFFLEEDGEWEKMALPSSVSSEQVYTEILKALESAQEIGYFAGCTIQ